MAWTNLAPSAWARRLPGLKRRAAPPSVDAPSDAPAPPPAPQRILVIDDDPITRLVLGAALRDAGYEVAEASDGAEGLAMFRANPAAAVVTDLVMPHHGGLETVRELRQNDPAVRIVVVSGVTGASAEHLRTAVRYGADRVLPKPVNLSELLVMVGGLLDRPVPGASRPEGVI